LESGFTGNSSRWKKEIDVSHVARGIYFIEIKTVNTDTSSVFFGVRNKIVIVK